MPLVTVPKVLRDKLGDDGADALVALINQADTQAKGDVLTFVEEKFERRLSEEVGKFNERLTVELGKVDERITTEIATLDKRITTEITKLDERITTEIARLNERITTEVTKLDERITTEITRLNERITTEVGRLFVEFAVVRKEMAELKADLIRWMFIFWAGQIGALLGILFAFFRR